MRTIENYDPTENYAAKVGKELEKKLIAARKPKVRINWRKVWTEYQRERMFLRPDYKTPLQRLVRKYMEVGP